MEKVTFIKKKEILRFRTCEWVCDSPTKHYILSFRPSGEPVRFTSNVVPHLNSGSALKLEEVDSGGIDRLADLDLEYFGDDCFVMSLINGEEEKRFYTIVAKGLSAFDVGFLVALSALIPPVLVRLLSMINESGTLGSLFSAGLRIDRASFLEEIRKRIAATPFREATDE
jgi:hypothetical protein